MKICSLQLQIEDGPEKGKLVWFRQASWFGDNAKKQKDMETEAAKRATNLLGVDYQFQEEPKPSGSARRPLDH